MAEKLNPSLPNLEPLQLTKLIYRGVGQEDNRPRMGQWWTTNPYYALAYAGADNGQMFVARIDTDALARMARDVSQDEGYENYGFVEQDPPEARVVTQAEIEALMTISQNEAGNTGTPDLPGGQLLKTPNNPVEAGRIVFEHTFELEK